MVLTRAIFSTIDGTTDDDEEDEDPKLVGLDDNSRALLSMVLMRAIFSAIDGTNDEDEDEEVWLLSSTASASESAPLTIMSSDCKITSVEKRSFVHFFV